VLERCAASGVKAKRLAVSHAFHSPLMERVIAPFAQLAATVRFGEPRLPLLSNLTGGEIAGRQASSADYWCRHLREPVRFADSMKWLRERHQKVFLEVGPGSTLLGLAQQTIPAEGRAWVASLRSGRAEWPHLLQAIGALYVGGAAPDWSRLARGRDVRRIVLPTYPFEGKRYRKTLLPTRGQGPQPEPPPAVLAAAASERRVATVDVRAELAATPADDRRERLVDHLLDQMAELMGFGAERPDPRRGFIELGVDSLMAVTLRNRLQASLRVDLPVTFIFDHPTVEVLADHLLANVLAAELQAPPPVASEPAAGRAALVDAVRDLSPAQIEDAITAQLKELGLH
jgi:acyl transferase domain-containing protein